MSSKLYIKFTPPAQVILPYEPETTAYMNNADVNIPDDGTVYFSATAYEITGSELWAALDAFLVSVKTSLGLTLKQNNLSTKFKYIYPRIGGTATAHRVNLATGTSDGIFNGGWTHDGSGAKPNGSNGYFQTGYSTDDTSLNSVSFGVNIKESYNALYPEGAQGSGFGDMVIYPRYLGLIYTRLRDTSYSTVTNSTSVGLILMTRISGTEYKVFRDSTLLATHTAGSAAGSTLELYEGCVNNGGSATQYGTGKRTVSLYGDGLTPTEVGDITTAVQTLDTALNR